MFPRVLQWMNMKVAKDKITIALNNNKVWKRILYE